MYKWIDRRGAGLASSVTALLLAGCMSTPGQLTTGLSCPPHVPDCNGPLVAAGGYNDMGTPIEVAALPPAIGPADAPRLLTPPATPALEEGSYDDIPEPSSIGDPAGPALALTPPHAAAGRVAPQPAAASAPPMDLVAQIAPVFPLADLDELELRSSDSPLSLTPPERPAEPVEPADAGALLSGGGAELLPDGADMPLPPQRTFSGEISVAGYQGDGPQMTLPEIVSRAASMNPEITLALARVDEARAGVQRARSGLAPQVDVSLAAGQSASGTYDPGVWDINNQRALGEGRVDASVRLRQMIFDFNATRDQLLSTLASSDAERLRTMDVTEDIALRTAQAYLRILQQRQLLALIDRNIEEHERLKRIVELNEADGNSTMADVNRVAARLSEVRSARTDLAADLDAAEDAFQRLARIEPGRLQPPAPVVARLAPSADDAIARAMRDNPRLLSLAYTVRSMQHELEVVNGDGTPRLDLEIEANSKTYINNDARTENDVRGMLVFSYSLFDGGDQAGEQREVEARIRQARARYVDSRDQVEADIRQGYRAIASARRKLDDLRSGLQSSREVQALYTEQFQAGERTIFELLDAQNALFSAERDLITSQFAELEAAYAVLRATGRLTQTLLSAER